MSSTRGSGAAALAMLQLRYEHGLVAAWYVELVHRAVPLQALPTLKP